MEEVLGRLEAAEFAAFRAPLRDSARVDAPSLEALVGRARAFRSRAEEQRAAVGKVVDGGARAETRGAHAAPPKGMRVLGAAKPPGARRRL
eukprot:6718445-Prymnesium_polylepis.2